MNRLEKVTNSKLEEIKIPPFESILKVRMKEVSAFITSVGKHIDKSSAIDKSLRDLFAVFDVQDLEHAFVALIKDKFFNGMNEQTDFSTPTKEHHSRSTRRFSRDDHRHRNNGNDRSSDRRRSGGRRNMRSKKQRV